MESLRMEADLRPRIGGAAGCLVPEPDGLIHRYIGTSLGCWTIFLQVLEKEYGDCRHAAVRGL